MHGRMVYPHEVSGLVTGKITIVYDYNTGASVPMVYQRVGRGFGNIRRLGERDLQLRSYPQMRDPRRPLQLAGRRRMAAAIHAYQNLTIEEREPYRTRAQPLIMSGYNLFIREFCQQHPITEFMEDRITIEFYGATGIIARPFTALKYYLLER